MFIIPGSPIPWARAGRRGTRYYDTQKDQKDRYAYLLADQLFKRGNQPMYEGPLELDVSFYFSSTSSSLRKEYNVEDDMPHFFKPDLSNLIKFIEDASQNILFKDDCAISRIVANKLYSDTCGTTLTIKPIDMSDYEK